mgnify:CR=1 FL=1
MTQIPDDYWPLLAKMRLGCVAAFSGGQPCRTRPL